MSPVSVFEKLPSHDFYHLRYGKGAIVVAIPCENVDESKLAWEERQQVDIEELECRKKHIEESINNLKERLQQVREVPKTPEIEEFVAITNDEINALKKEYRALKYTPKAYFSNLQLAQFYSHDIPPQSESTTRFDEILYMEEIGSHVKIVLRFSALPQENHFFHRNIGVAQKLLPDRKNYSRIEGIVERVLPIENVTLEIVRQSSVK